MERSLKARLIGASVLVLVIVLVVPELLSGRKATSPVQAAPETGKGPTRTYTIELGNTQTPAAADAVVPRPLSPMSSPLEAERPAQVVPRPVQREAAPATGAQPAADSGAPPAPTAKPTTSGQPSVATTSTRPSTSAPRSAPAPVPRAEPSATPGSARGTWSVQVGAFGSADSARKLLDSLTADGYAAYVSTTRRDGKTLHRVRVGPESARGAADALAGRLKARGLPVTLVAND